MYVYALLWRDNLKIHGLLAAGLEGGEVTDSSVEHIRVKGDLICHPCHFLFYPSFFIVVILCDSFFKVLIGY